MKACPSCAHTLHVADFDGVKVDGCRACGGVWFDADGFQHIARAAPVWLVHIDSLFAPRSPSVAVVAHSTECPNCRVPLTRSEFWLHRLREYINPDSRPFHGCGIVRNRDAR